MTTHYTHPESFRPPEYTPREDPGLDTTPSDTSELIADKETLSQLKQARDIAVRGLYLSTREGDPMLSRRRLDELYEQYSFDGNSVLTSLVDGDEIVQGLYEGEDDNLDESTPLRMVKARRAFEQNDNQGAKDLLHHAIGTIATHEVNGITPDETDSLDELIAPASTSDETLADYANFMARVEYLESRHRGDKERLQRVTKLAQEALAIYAYSYSQTHDPNTLAKIDSIYSQLRSDYSADSAKNANWSLTGENQEEPKYSEPYEPNDDALERIKNLSLEQMLSRY